MKVRAADARDSATGDHERFLIVPGLGDSGARHWQTRWQQQFDLPRVVQPDWNTPDIASWGQTLETYLRRSPAPVVILAHSFGCLATVSAAARLNDKIRAALLVAPADPEKFALAGWLPNHSLSFPSILVASRNDPWIPLAQAKLWADRWGSGFVDIGKAGHINAESGFGDWSGGWELARSLAAAPGPVQTATTTGVERTKFNRDSMRPD